jgi:hypothetical protein
MYGKMVGLFNIFDERGVEIDQGTLLRYLGEMVWFPTAFLGENITWQAVDDHCANLTLSDGGQTVSAQMRFDAAGRPVNFNALRYGDFEGEYSLQSWSVPMILFEERSGLNIPVRGMVTWNLPSGDLPYYEWNISEVEYNRR